MIKINRFYPTVEWCEFAKYNLTEKLTEDVYLTLKLAQDACTANTGMIFDNHPKFIDFNSPTI